ncbi:MAG: Rab family GTPase [Promethearchaeota archaeon]
MKIEKDIITGIVYSRFHSKVGPTAIAWLPSDLSAKIREYISLKSINVLVGEHGSLPKSLAIIPFPSLDLKGLIRCFEIKDLNERGGAVDNSLTLLFNEKNDPIFYKYIDNFEYIFEETVNTITGIPKENKAKIYEELGKFQSNLNVILKELWDTEISMQETELFPTEAEEEIADFRFKIIVCGDPQVGKTSTILRFTDKAFRRSYIPTIGVNISEKTIRYDNNTVVNFTLWDIAGQSKFQVARKHFYRGARGQILVFDLTRPETFNNIMKWFQDIKQHLQKDIQGLILGNKSDLVAQRKVTREQISQLAEKLGIEFLETSALSGENVEKAFFKLGELIFKEDDRSNLFKHT